MSRIALSGSAAGSGTFTLAAPNSDSSYTLNLPQVSGGTLVSTDASGNVGLGVTPSAWGGGYKAMQLGGYTNIADTGGGYSFYINNGYVSGSGWKYVTNNKATLYQNGVDGQHIWYTAPSGTAGTAISFTQAMTLDAGGSLGVGAAAVSSKIYAYQNAANSPTRIVSENGHTGSNFDYASVGVKTDLVSGGVAGWATGSVRAGQMWLSVNEAVPLIFGTADTERMRITSSGQLSIGTSSPPSDSKVVAYNNASGIFALTIINASASGYGFSVGTDSGNIAYFYGNSARNGAPAGAISCTSTTTTYATSSDYRLKENVQPMQNALDVVQQLNPVTYTWKADGSDGQGFIAHELQAVVPDCVTGEKDAVDAEGNPVYQGIDTSFLVATLVKAIQEQQEQINQLKAEVAALKSA